MAPQIDLALLCGFGMNKEIVKRVLSLLLQNFILKIQSDFKTHGQRVNQIPKYRVPVAPQNGDLLPPI